MDIQLDSIFDTGFEGRLRRLLGFRLRRLEFRFIDIETLLFGHETSEIDGEAKGVVQHPNVGSVQLFQACFLRTASIALEQLLSSVQSPREGLLLFVQKLFQIGCALVELWEETTLQRKAWGQ